jgi:hypothetical protein
MCNVARKMLVVFPRNDHDAVQVRLNVEVAFNGNTLDGDYDCGSTAKLIGQYTKLTAIPRIAKLLGWIESNIALFSTCSINGDECFDTRANYNIDKPWKEPKKCVTPTKSI